MAVPRPAGASPTTDSPPIQTSPSVGVSCPAIIHRIVVLPQPLGPSKQQYLPWGILKLIASTATVWSKRLVSLRSTISHDTKSVARVGPRPEQRAAVLDQG